MKYRLALPLLLLLISTAGWFAIAQNPPPPGQGGPPQGQRGPRKPTEVMPFEEYDPKSMLVVPEHPVLKAKYPFVDVHHHPQLKTQAEVDKLIKDMDNINLQVMVDLSGGFGDRLKQNVEIYQSRYKDRFVIFTNFDFRDVDNPDYSARLAKQIEDDYKAGARGLKIFKNFGMDLKDKNGQRIHTDDPRFDAAFEACGRLGMPVLIHTAEPQAFFQPIDKHNERWLELQQFPGRARPPERYPDWETLMQEQWRMFKRHPKTKFISAHMSWLGSDLGRLSKLMDEIPNMYTEIGAVLYDIGRQPRAAHAFFVKYQDRVFFGKDAWEPRDPIEYQCYFRVLETNDEYFDYYRKRHAFWKMYGIGLPDDVLKKFYYKNALKLIPSINASQFPK